MTQQFNSGSSGSSNGGITQFQGNNEPFNMISGIGTTIVSSKKKFNNRDIENLPKTIYISCIDPRVNESYLLEYFRYCGVITNFKICGEKGRSTKFAFIEFSTQQEAEVALSINGNTLGDYSLNISPSKTAIQQPSPFLKTKNIVNKEILEKTIHCGNLDLNLSEIQVKDFFESNCGKISKIVLVGNKQNQKRYGFIEFANKSSVNPALNLTNTLVGKKSIKVSLSKSTISNGNGKTHRNEKQPITVKIYKASSVNNNNDGENDDDLNQQRFSKPKVSNTGPGLLTSVNQVSNYLRGGNHNNTTKRTISIKQYHLYKPPPPPQYSLNLTLETSNLNHPQPQQKKNNQPQQPQQEKQQCQQTPQPLLMNVVKNNTQNIKTKKPLLYSPNPSIPSIGFNEKKRKREIENTTTTNTVSIINNNTTEVIKIFKKKKL